MGKDMDVFKIESNKIFPDKGKILISEPFLHDVNFNRSVILLVDHNEEGSMGIIMNKSLPLLVNDVVAEFKYLEDIPLYRGGPVGTDVLFYLHTLKGVEGAIQIGNGMFLNGDFNAIKRYILQGNIIQGCIRFFLGYSGWSTVQLQQEIKENTWMVGVGESALLLSGSIEDMWKESMGKLGSKYLAWTRFPVIPALN